MDHCSAIMRRLVLPGCEASIASSGQSGFVRIHAVEIRKDCMDGFAQTVDIETMERDAPDT
jgi:hypothetical protein